MENKSLSEVCFELLSNEVKLERVPGVEDLENVRLLNGEEGGGIKIYRGERIDKVTLVDFHFKRGAPIPHYDNAIAVGAEVFQILPDLSCKVPIWGINSIILENGEYHFDTDFSFGFDLVMDYEFTMKYLEPFNEVYKKFCRHPDFKRVTLDKTTTWVRAYISPVFIIAEATVDKVATVYDLCAEFIKLWVRIWKEAEKRDEVFKQAQKKRIFSQYAGMKDTDRMGKVLKQIYGEETFMKFFKAMA
jgi:hypothetical protein